MKCLQKHPSLRFPDTLAAGLQGRAKVSPHHWAASSNNRVSVRFQAAARVRSLVYRGAHSGPQLKRLFQAVQLSKAMSDQGPWTCGVCTFDNKAQASKCAVCNSARPSQSLINAGDQNHDAQQAAEGGSTSWACGHCTFENTDGAARCGVCDHEREQMGEREVKQGSERERKRKRNAGESSDGEPPRAPVDPERSERKAAEGKDNERGKGKETLIVLDDDESPQSALNLKGKGIASQSDSATDLGGSGSEPTGASLLHQLHLERLARRAVKAGGPIGSGLNATTNGADTVRSTQREQLGGQSAGVGVRERAGSAFFSRPDLAPTKAAARNFASTSGGVGPPPSANTSNEKATSGSAATDAPLVVLSYNVWFNESVELQRRMAAIGAIIEEHSPDVIFFQEVTPNIYSIFRQARWWGRGGYKCSLAPAQIDRQYFAMMVSRLSVKAFRHEPFPNSVMGRDLVTAKANVGDMELTLATTHLESPTGRDQLFSEPRVAQARTALARLAPERNVIFGGDMNWNDQRDGPVPLPDGWVDPWLELHRAQPGYTYNSVLNQMLLGTLKGRLDRFFCRLTDFSVRSVEMVGRDPLPGVTYEKPGWGRNPRAKTLPVLPSDHFGLLLKVVRKGR